MVQEEVIQYIKSSQASGYTVDQIRKQLLNQGYTSADIEEAIAKVQQESPPKSASPTEGRPKRSLLFIFIPLLILIIITVLVYLFIASKAAPGMQIGELSEETSIALSEGEKISFTVNNEDHSLEVTSVRDDTVNIIVRSTISTFTLSPSEEKEVDFDRDGINDLRVKVKSILSGKVDVSIEAIGQKSCGACEYLENNVCTLAVCCSNAECDDGNDLTRDICVAPGTVSANCQNTQPTSGQDTCVNDTDCNDNDIGTKDTCSGNPKACSLIPIIECLDSDGYCPATCLAADDNDCTTEELIAEFVDCDNDVSCFIDLANNCSQGSIIFDIKYPPLDFFGAELVINTTSYLELQGYDSEGLCTYFNRNDGYSIGFSENYKTTLLNLGNSIENITLEEISLNESSQSIVGLKQLCTLDETILIQALNNWQQGSFSSSSECSLNEDGTTTCTHGEDDDLAGAVCLNYY